MIEVVEFYRMLERPSKKRAFGSLHVYIEEGSIDLRGIRVFHPKKGIWFFHLPTVRTLDRETQKEVVFPIFSYLDKKKDLELKEKIREVAIPYIEQKIKEKKQKKKKQCKLKTIKKNTIQKSRNLSQPSMSSPKS